LPIQDLDTDIWFGNYQTFEAGASTWDQYGDNEVVNPEEMNARWYIRQIQWYTPTEWLNYQEAILFTR
jgi:hypothetical protein